MRLQGITGAALALAAAVALAGAPATAATSTTTAATLADGSVTLSAVVQVGGLLSVAQFQYGATTQYGSTTTSITLAPTLLPITVTATLSGLADGTYHYRVVTTSGLFSTYGPDETFTIQSQGGLDPATGTISSTTSATLAGSSTSVGVGTTVGGGNTGGSGGPVPSPVTLTPPGGQSSAGDGDDTGNANGSGASSHRTAGTPGAGRPASGPTTDAGPTPTYGRSDVVGKRSGVVLVRPPGASTMVPVQASASVPDGTLVDARHGVVALSSALEPNGATQTVVAWGGSFRVHYDHVHAGRIDLRLAGGSFRACRRLAAHTAMARHGGRRHSGRRRGHRLARHASQRVIRSLWAHDDHGRYTTQGNDSVATVRGTTWLTQDRCDGTLTRVKRGVVDVRDRASGRTFVVRAGHAHLAPRL